MEDSYIRADGNKIINEKCIRWVVKMDECLEICAKPNGCYIDKKSKDTITLCRINNPNSYDKFNKWFLDEK